MGPYPYLLPRRMNPSRTPLHANRPRRAADQPAWQMTAIVGVLVLATLLAGWLVFASVRDFVAGRGRWGDAGPGYGRRELHPPEMDGHRPGHRAGDGH